MHRPTAPEPTAPIVARILGPFQQFFATTAAGGILLLACTIVALIWANSPWAASYHHLWETDVGFGAANLAITLSLHAWVNDGLMAVFFFLVGLEIKREVLVGELSTRRTAALPVAAALGGMIVPAVLYSLVNGGGPGAAGWGIPMATDIAFALGILALLGDRVPTSLRVFLAALAIADDLGAVLVIAPFYTSTINMMALLGAGVVLMILLGLNKAGIHRPVIYLGLGVVLWYLMLRSGIHATIAGMLLALVVPARTRIGEDEFLRQAHQSLAAFRAADAPGTTVLSSREHQEALHGLERATEALQRLEHALHGLVAFFVMPVFALANAGVPLADLGAASRSAVVAGIVLGLFVGKPLGITVASWFAVRSGVAELPEGVAWRHVHGAAWLGGIGFTMSLFIASLAFSDAATLDRAKVGILVASIGAGVIGFLLLRRAPAPDRAPAADHGAVTS